MRIWMKVGATTCAAAALAGLAAAGGGAAPQRQQVLVLGSPNRTPASRTDRSIDQIVIHVTQGPYGGSIRWMRKQRARGASHFVVSRRGALAQLVGVSDVAWHAGNAATNRRSIGIEHAGYVRRSFPDVQYRASARLVAYLAVRHGIRIDRRHIIGHAEVPNPRDPRRRGGADGHWDPGPNWDWARYLALVRAYAKHPQAPQFVSPRGRRAPVVRGAGAAVEVAAASPAPPSAAPGTPGPRPLAVALGRAGPAAAKASARPVRCGFRPSVHSTTLYAGQVVAGLVPWEARGCGRRLHRVDFLVDGRLVWVDRTAPFTFARGRGWNSTAVANGWHTLTLRAHGPQGHRVRKRLRIRVENALYEVRPAGLAERQAVTGVVGLGATVTAPTRRVSLFVDGRLAARDGRAPYRFAIDSAQLPPGDRVLTLVADAPDGRRTQASVRVVSANPVDPSAAAPSVMWQAPHDWETVRGRVAWQALVEGEVRQVELWVDGRLAQVDREAPYGSGGAGELWDSTAVERGPHRLVVRAVGVDGGVAERAVTVLVAG
jgi:N-acetyl-anhydromuramyl-L-alanine amidase AmpD